MILALYIGESKCFSYLLDTEKVEVKSYFFSLPPDAFLKSYTQLGKEIIKMVTQHFSQDDSLETYVFSANKKVSIVPSNKLFFSDTINKETIQALPKSLILVDERSYLANGDKINFSFEEKEIFKYMEVAESFLDFKNIIYNRFLLGSGNKLSQQEKYVEEALLYNQISQIFKALKTSSSHNEYLISSSVLPNLGEEAYKKFLIILSHFMTSAGVYNFSFDTNLFVPLFYALSTFNLDILNQLFLKVAPKPYFSLALFPKSKEAFLDFKIGQKQKVALSKSAIAFIPVESESEYTVSITGNQKVSFEGPKSQKGIVFDFRQRPLSNFNNRSEITAIYGETIKELDNLL